MKKKLKNIVCSFFLLGVAITMKAQTKTLVGNVSDASGPLPGVSILIKESNKGTETNFDGNYSIEAKDGDILVFRYLGYKTLEKKVGNSNTINVKMLEDSSELEEVVVVAYGTSIKEALTGSVGIVTAKDLELRNVTSPIAALEGNVTGVQFTSASGQPGSSPGIVIRGVGTLNGSSTPLFIVDGIQFEGSLNTINQEDIASFSVLKGAASTSIYGARAANGVVVITTKKGISGGVKTSFSTQMGVVSIGVPFYDEVTPGGYYESMWQALKNSTAGNGNPNFASENIYNQLAYNPFNVPNDQIVGVDGKLNPDAEVIYKSLNWYDALQRTAVRKNYNVNVSGGGDKSKVFFSASYLDEEGYIIRSQFNRLTTRVNGEFDAADWIKIGGSANITIAESNTLPGGAFIVNPFSFAKGIGSIYPVYVNDLQGNLVRDSRGDLLFDNGEGFPDFNIGSRPRNQGRHAIQELLLNDDLDRDNTYGFRYFADFTLLEGLKLSLNYGRDINEGINKRFRNTIIGDAEPDGRYGETRFRRDVENFTQVLSYTKTFHDVHNVDFTLGHESFYRQYSSNNANAIVQIVEGISEFDNFSLPENLSGSSTVKTIEGYFFRANYNYDNKYYISGSVRRDGSSVFDKRSRWGNFFAVGASWRIDQEEFIKNISFIDRLKIRASFGEVGNDDLNDFFLSQPRYDLSSNAGNPALIWNEIGNADVQWETIENYDVAIEFGLFNNFLEGSFEYYRRNSTDLLYDLPIPTSNGLNTFPTNIADMYNDGFEIGLTGHLINKENFKWDLTLQATTLNNKITSIPNPFITGSKRWAEGRSRYDFFLLRTAEVDPATGDQLFYKYEINDAGESVPVLDDDGNIEKTNEWQDTERAYTGDSSVPDLLGSVLNSFSYKGINLNFLLTYGIGGEILDNGYSAMMHSGNYGASLHPDVLRAWRQPGDITDVPRLENGNADLVRTQSSRFLTDASFLTLRNVNLSYSLNKSITDTLGLSSLRVSLTGENLFILSERNGLNPQASLAGTSSGIGFNPSKIFSLGLNVSF